MHKLIYFKLPSCPFCRQANEWMSELIKENPEYENIVITVVDESKDRALARKYDYYLVPSYFIGEIKLHEGVATKDKIRQIFDSVLKDSI